ncbi:MAG: hypothetical protein A2W31_12545 [Planctomycetes bacterium RBG_16_64_10]|nr:MAG: hypothetical protein A2W31_12545 [Planctomycetes bacterium RBG_16_64_10]
MADRRHWARAVWPVALVWLIGLTSAAPPAPATDVAPPSGAENQVDPQETYELFRMLADAVDQIERNYVQPISRRELIEAALDGIVRKLDPHSSYIAPAAMEQFRRSVDSHYGGIGIQVDVQQGQLMVRGSMAGAPAYRAGLRAGDQILAIDGQSTDAMRLDEAIRRIKGPPGTHVPLSVRHAGANEVEQIDLLREVIRIDTVLPARRRTGGTADFLLDPAQRIGYARITVFSRDTPDELERVLVELREQKLRGLVLDLRFNPGGLLSSAVRVADLFLAEGRIVTVTGRNAQRRDLEARKEGTYDGFPLVLLVNQYSASASEILAACLQDHGRAVIVGQRTWGKGSVQNVIELEGGRSALKITTSQYLRPNGQNIHRFPGAGDDDAWGVKPSQALAVPLSDQETSQLFRYYWHRDLMMLGRTDSAGKQNQDTQPDDPAAPQPAADSAPQFVDRQLNKALTYLAAELARAD